MDLQAGMLSPIAGRINDSTQQLWSQYNGASRDWEDRAYNNFMDTAGRRLRNIGDSFVSCISNAAHIIDNAVREINSALSELPND